MLDLPVTKGSKGVNVSKEKTEPIPDAGLAIDFEDKTIFCFPISYNQGPEMLAYLKQKKEKAVIGLAPALNLDFLEAADKISSPRTAFCEKRLESLGKIENLPAALSRILIKIAIHRRLKPGYDMSEIRWNWLEIPFLPRISADPLVCPLHQCGYAKSLAGISRMKFTDLKSLFLLALDWQVRFPDKLMLFDPANIEEEFTDAVLETYNLRKIRNAFSILYPIEKESASQFSQTPGIIEQITNELDLFFGILHLVYLKREGEFAQNLVVSDAEREGERFGKLFHPAQKLADKLGKLDAYLENQITLADKEDAVELAGLRQKMKNFGDFLKIFKA